MLINIQTDLWRSNFGNLQLFHRLISYQKDYIKNDGGAGENRTLMKSLQSFRNPIILRPQTVGFYTVEHGCTVTISCSGNTYRLGN